MSNVMISFDTYATWVTFLTFLTWVPYTSSSMLQFSVYLMYYAIL